jgi:hypothetical protein
MELVHVGSALLTVSIIAVPFWIGGVRAKLKERIRVVSLIHSALQVRHSGSLCWVLNAVDTGKTNLCPEERFFGPPKVEDKPVAP